MFSFDFVSDEDLRASLESDAAEMADCLQVKAYKSVMVLAGSIVEALLTDHLDSIGYVDPAGKSLLEMDLGHLIAAARSQKVLSDKAADLSSAVKDYRNLIHPGRRIRLNEKVDASTAAIAGHLVDVVAAEVAELKRDSYGYTAQQIVTKVEHDSSSIAILGDLLTKTKEKELASLLTTALPGRYSDLAPLEDEDSDYYGPVLRRFRTAYRTAFEAAPEPVKRRVVKAYARVLREEVAESIVLTREEAFFEANDLAYMTPDDASMAQRHLMARVERVLPDELHNSLKGIGTFVGESDLGAIVDSTVRSVTSADGPFNRRRASVLLQRLFGEAPRETAGAIIKRLANWEKTLGERNPDVASWIGEQRSTMEVWDDLPF